VMPIIFAQTIIIVPGTIASFTKNPVLTDIASFFQPGDLPYDLTFAVLILLFSYFYTSIIFNSVDLAENLKKQGGFIPGVKPGASTADYIDGVLSRITLPGGLFLAGIALLPILVSKGALLAERLGLPKFATGDLLRDAVKRGTPLGLQAKAVMEAGHLVSDDIILGVIRDELAKPEASKGVIFDGVVRTIPQAEGMERILKEQGRKLDAVLF